MTPPPPSSLRAVSAERLGRALVASGNNRSKSIGLNLSLAGGTGCSSCIISPGPSRAGLNRGGGGGTDSAGALGWHMPGSRGAPEGGGPAFSCAVSSWPPTSLLAPTTAAAPHPAPAWNFEHQQSPPAQHLTPPSQLPLQPNRARFGIQLANSTRKMSTMKATSVHNEVSPIPQPF